MPPDQEPAPDPLQPPADGPVRAWCSAAAAGSRHAAWHAGSRSPPSTAKTSNEVGNSRAARWWPAGHIAFDVWMKSISLAGIVLIVESVIPAGDVDVGDVIVLPDADEPVLVSRVRLGQGGLIFTVTQASGESREEELVVKLTAEVRLRNRGRDMAR